LDVKNVEPEQFVFEEVKYQENVNLHHIPEGDNSHNNNNQINSICEVKILSSQDDSSTRTKVDITPNKNDTPRSHSKKLIYSSEKKSRSTPRVNKKSHFCQSPAMQYKQSSSMRKIHMQSTVQTYLFAACFVFAFILIGDGWFVNLYSYMSSQDTLLSRPGVYTDDRLLYTAIVSPADNEISTSAQLQWWTDGLALIGNSDRVERELRLKVVLDGRELEFTGGNNMTIVLKGKLDLSLDLGHYGLRSGMAHVVEVQVALGEYVYVCIMYACMYVVCMCVIKLKSMCMCIFLAMFIT
jgi:hypothetical protein